MLYRIFLITLILLLFGCDGNYRSVKVTGLVSEKISGNPIKDADIIINCWVYDTEIWESKAIEKNTKTDSNGKFLINFKKGEALDITVKSEGYNEHKESITLRKSTNNFEIKLLKK